MDSDKTERVIKRYENRKLYDPTARCYVTVDDVGALVAAGQDVRVEDRATGDDITSLVLAQVVQELVRKRSDSIPSPVLARLIRLAAAPAVPWSEWVTPHDAASRAKDEAEKIVGRLLARGRLTIEDGLALRQEITGTVQRLVGDAQHGLEGRLRGLVVSSGREDGVGPTLQGLMERLLTFETYLGDGDEPTGDKPARRVAARERRPKSAARTR